MTTHLAKEAVGIYYQPTAAFEQLQGMYRASGAAYIENNWKGVLGHRDQFQKKEEGQVALMVVLLPLTTIEKNQTKFKSIKEITIKLLSGPSLFGGNQFDGK